MKISGTLSLYIARNFFLVFLGFFFGLLALVLMLDGIELLRRAGAKPDIGAGLILEMALLKLPHMGQMLFPFATLFSGMATFWRLSRSSELAITRAAGISAWQFLLPVLMVAVGLGVFKLAAFNPLASITLERFQQLEATYFKRQKGLLAISASGLWLRQGIDNEQSVIHARTISQVSQQSASLGQVMIILYRGADEFAGRIDAERAVLEEGYWRVEKAWISEPETPSYYLQEYTLPTDLTITKIQDNFASPETMSFWDLPGFIGVLEKSGFSAVRHRLHFHSLLAGPVLLVAMILIGAAFTLRHARRGGTAYVVAGGAITGFLLYFTSDVVFALGISESIPVVLAAWATPLAATMLGVAMLFHLEDG